MFYDKLDDAYPGDLDEGDPVNTRNLGTGG